LAWRTWISFWVFRMNVLVIFCHPRTHSYNHALAERVVQVLETLDHTVVFHDLYREHFDPVLEEAELHRKLSFDPVVLRHIGELERADALVIIHPDWWSQPPALLKGWIERVLQIGVAYEFEGPEFMKKRQRPLLSEKIALVFATRDGNEQDELLSRLWIDGVFRYCGFKASSCHVLHGLRDLDRSDRFQWLDRVESVLMRTLPRGT